MFVNKNDANNDGGRHTEDTLEPLVVELEITDDHETTGLKSRGGGSIWMVMISTFFAVCWSFKFRTCIGYSSPTQSGIMKELGLSLLQGIAALIIGTVFNGYGSGIFSYLKFFLRFFYLLDSLLFPSLQGGWQRLVTRSSNSRFKKFLARMLKFLRKQLKFKNTEKHLETFPSPDDEFISEKIFTCSYCELLCRLLKEYF
ncbi:hypothetical protein Sjap_006698 [Stephania japonica]|uniref:Uncharacterized protein n=1 Tax=Stephania japonica TaxID=461633 RepID=A0AAP0K7H2_9MAGN